MKKNIMFVLAIVAVFFSMATAAKAEITPMTEWEMKHTLLIGFVAFYEIDSNTPVDPLDEERKEIRNRLVAQIPGKEKMLAIYTVPIVVQAGTDLAAFFPVGATVYDHVANVTNTAGPSSWSGPWGSAETTGASYIRTCLTPASGGFTGVVIYPR